MELRHLRYFLAIAEHASFTHAAKVVHVTQSTLSHQIHQLEEEIGHRLFDRIGRTVTLTKAGEAFLPGVRRALKEIDGAIRNVKNASGKLTGEVRMLIGTHTFALDVLPLALEQFQLKNSSVRVIVKETTSRLFMSEMVSGDYDIAVGEEMEQDAGLTFEPLYAEEFGLTVSRSHPLAGRKRIRMIELHRLPVAMPSSEIAARRVLDRCLQSVGAEPNIVAELNMFDTMREVARLCKTSAVLSPDTMNDNEVVFIPIEDPKPERIVGFYWKAENSLARLFADTIRRVLTAAETSAMRSPRIHAYVPPKARRPAIVGG